MTETGRLNRNAARASVAVAVVLIGLKLWASLATGSVAMLGSLADSSLDLIASLVTLLAVGVAAQPADDDHRFGHGKAEAISALLQTLLILGSAAAIAWRAVATLLAGEAPRAAGIGIAVSAISIALTLVLVAYQRRVVARTGSLAIGTDRLHYESDLLLNLAVIGALVLDVQLGLRGADPVLGFAIAVYLAWGAVRAARAAIDMLMDREWPPEKRDRLVDVACEHPDVLGLHDLRTRSSGAVDFIQFHIALPPEMTVRDAHDVVDAVEARVAAAFPDAEILIHIDPDGHTEEPLADKVRRHAPSAPAV